MSKSTKAIFLSYASQDADTAQRICAALRAAELDVWFDQSELRSFGYTARGTADELAAARAGLESAVREEPAYADAWAMLLRRRFSSTRNSRAAAMPRSGRSHSILWTVTRSLFWVRC
jgi:hypothetical protein